jgi:hypothetical protein
MCQSHHGTGQNILVFYQKLPDSVFHRIAQRRWHTIVGHNDFREGSNRLLSTPVSLFLHQPSFLPSLLCASFPGGRYTHDSLTFIQVIMISTLEEAPGPLADVTTVLIPFVLCIRSDD